MKRTMVRRKFHKHCPNTSIPRANTPRYMAYPVALSSVVVLRMRLEPKAVVPAKVVEMLYSV